MITGNPLEARKTTGHSFDFASNLTVADWTFNVHVAKSAPKIGYGARKPNETSSDLKKIKETSLDTTPNRFWFPPERLEVSYADIDNDYEGKLADGITVRFRKFEMQDFDDTLRFYESMNHVRRDWAEFVGPNESREILVDYVRKSRIDSCLWMADIDGYTVATATFWREPRNAARLLWCVDPYCESQGMLKHLFCIIMNAAPHLFDTVRAEVGESATAAIEALSLPDLRFVREERMGLYPIGDVAGEYERHYCFVWQRPRSSAYLR